MKRMLLLPILSAALLGASLAAGLAADSFGLPSPVLLWPEGAPKALGADDEDKPAVTAFLPDPARNTGAAILVCPGGGFQTRCVDFEGVLIAQWFKQRGIAAFILRYRIQPLYNNREWLMDGQRAMQFLRAHAEEYKIATNRIGVIGFSAGADLASTITTSALAPDLESKDVVSRFGSRPDFTVLAYGGSVRGSDTSDNAKLKAQWPPAFFFCTQEDKGHLTGMLTLYSALVKANVPCEAHFFQSGEHGVGFAEGDPTLGAWPIMMENWLLGQGFTTGEKRLTLSGIVKLDGTPLVRGYVIFTPLQVKGAATVTAHVFNSGPGLEGEYKISPNQGFVPGKYRVEVRQDATRWLSNSRNPLMQRRNSDEERKATLEYARKRDLSPSIEGQRIYSKAHPGDKDEMIINIKPGMTTQDIEVFSK